MNMSIRALPHWKQIVFCCFLQGSALILLNYSDILQFNVINGYHKK